MSLVIGAFETREQAAAAVDQVVAGGFAPDQVSVLGRHGEVATLTSQGETASDVATGASIGAALGGFGVIAVGVAALAIPGLGPVLALGPFAAALPVAVAGGLAGVLIGFLRAQGLAPEEADRYAERVRAGAYLVAVHAEAAQEVQAEQLLASSHRAIGSLGQQAMHEMRAALLGTMMRDVPHHVATCACPVDRVVPRRSA